MGSTDKCNPKIGRLGLTWIVSGEAKGRPFKFYREASNTVANWLNMARGSLPQHKRHYEAINLGLEDGPHIAIPRSIRGGFSLLTASSGM